jgi:hypothetical protein
MTPFDRGYLKALYTGSGDQRAIAKIDQIARTIAATRERADRSPP